MFDQKAVFVDVETTGGNATCDRVTEIAILEMRDGRLVSEWSTLIDPGVSIPGYIQALTGITDEMVRGCPAFSEIHEEVLGRLSGSLFVAHNARFDYGFVKNEFRRCGIRYQAPVLCTVKLSRSLFPGYTRHNLDSLIHRHNLNCGARHRASGDARVVFDFMTHLFTTENRGRVTSAIDNLLKKPALPPGIEPEILDDLPEGPGVYRFLGVDNAVLYVGKSINVRDRVLSHFSGDHASNRDMKINAQIRSIEVTETAGELGALLLEAQLVKNLSPVYNRRLRRYDTLLTIRWDSDSDQSVPAIISTTDMHPVDIQQHYGLFRTKRQAENALRNLVREHGLCESMTGLHKGKGPCFGYHVKRCRGTCVGEESYMQHRIRLLEALQPLKNRTWPYRGRIGIREVSLDGDRTDLHLFNHWCYLGTVHSEDELNPPDLFNSRQPAFDIDTYKILQRFFRQKRRRDIRVLE